MSGIHQQADEFEEQVSAILQLRGYSIERNCTVEGTQIDLIAKSQDSLNDLEYLVECCSSGSPVGIALVKEKAGVLLKADSRRRLLYVSSNGFTREAKEFAKAKEVIYLTTLEELERTLLDLRPYARWLVSQFEKSEGMFNEAKLFNYYVPLRCKDFRNRDFDLNTAVSNWLQTTSNGLLFILGEYGCGKTSFCRHYTYSVCKELQLSRADPLTPIPVLINLRDYRRTQNIEQIITDTLLNRYGVRITSFGHFQRFCATGRVMLLLDGFDEMVDSVGRSAVKESFQQIYLLSSLGAKVVVTCRTNYFRSHQEIIDLLSVFSVKLSDLLGQPEIDGVLSFKGLATIVEVSPLADGEVFEYLKRRFGTKAKRVLAQLKAIHDLTDLSRRPVLLDMICETLPELVTSGKRTNSATLYELYTKRWTRRDEWRTTLPEEIRQDFCEALAWLSHLANLETLEPDLIRDAVLLGFGGLGTHKDQLETFLHDIQTCSFLVRAGMEQSFRFAHKSFREFFVARRLVRELIGGELPTREGVDEFFVKRKQRDEEVINTAHEASIRTQAKKDKKQAARNSALSAERIGVSILSLSGNPWMSLQRLRRSMHDESFFDLFGTVASQSPKWTDQKTQKLLSETSFLDRLQELFGIKADQDFLDTLRLTPEIATFALEILVSSEIGIHSFLAGLTEEKERRAFITLVNIGRSRQFFDFYLDELCRLITRSHEWWMTDLPPLLARWGPKLSNKQINAISGNLTPETLSRFQFGLLTTAYDYRQSFESCFLAEDLTPIQRILVAVGKNRRRVENAADVFIEALPIASIVDYTTSEKEFIEEVFAYAASSSPTQTSRILVSRIRETADEHMKVWLISLLAYIKNDGMLSSIRQLIASEKNKVARAKLRMIERELLDTRSLKKAHASRQQNKRPFH